MTQPPSAGPGRGAAGPGDPRDPGGSLRPTAPRVLVVWAVVGLVLGWLVRPVTERFGVTPPIVTWTQPSALALVAAILGLTAWLTHRAVQVQRVRLLPHQAVNRLVLARACALVGALVAGLYGGYAVAWLGLEAELASQRTVRSALAALAGLAICAAALLLERACRVRNDDPAP